MAVMAQCPVCRQKQSNQNKKCTGCGEDLVKAKKSNRVKYWIMYKVEGRKIWEYIGISIRDAQDADGKRKAQKRENPFFSTKNNRITFQELTDWYLSQSKIKKKGYFKTLQYRLTKWNALFGSRMVLSIKSSELQNHQESRLEEGWAESTIDQELGAAQTMIQYAIDDDMISGDALKPFRKIERLVKGNSNARDRIITLEEFYRIMDAVPEYAKGIVSLGFFAGMRLGEIMGLTWDKVNLQHDTPHIKLQKTDTKEGREKIVPLACRIKGNPYELLKVTPKGIHDDHVFLYRGKPLSRIRDGFSRACDDVGLNYGRFARGGFIFHDLRHCFNTYMRRAGVDQLTIMKIMGHSPGKNLEMTFRYSTFELQDLGLAIEKLENYFMNGKQIGGEESFGKR
ncbi:MAG: site-specific integrase [bacterium]